MKKNNLLKLALFGICMFLGWVIIENSIVLGVTQPNLDHDGFHCTGCRCPGPHGNICITGDPKFCCALTKMTESPNDQFQLVDKDFNKIEDDDLGFRGDDLSFEVKCFVNGELTGDEMCDPEKKQAKYLQCISSISD